ncbi:MAG: hypothetical protein U9Q81_04255 [Pseudomonadota bacterium]|nr:hypothetical protein [Pseudomonadota bacterium]
MILASISIWLKELSRLFGLFERKAAETAADFQAMPGDHRMKTLIAASALSLTANIAFAYDYAGNFAGPDIYAHFDNNYGVEYPAPTVTSSGVEPSLHDFYAGNPDVYTGRIPGYVPIRSVRGPQFTSLDELTFGNPDSGTGVRLAPPIDVEEAIASGFSGSDDPV